MISRYGASNSGRPLPVVLGCTISQRIVFAGPFGVGKTTAISSISDVPVVQTEEFSLEREPRSWGKSTTTVGIDYGEWQFSQNETVGLIGLPGQKRFDSTWDALLGASAATILWLFGNTPKGLDEAVTWIDLLVKRSCMKRCTVAVTRMAEPMLDKDLDPYRDLVRPHNPWVPVISADPRNKMDVIQAVAIALAQSS